MKKDTLEFIKNTLDAIRGYLRNATDLLEQGCGLYDEDENQATYDALFATLNNGIWEVAGQNHCVDTLYIRYIALSVIQIG